MSAPPLPLDEMARAGFSEEEILSAVGGLQAEMRAAGFSEEEIRATFQGRSPFDEAPLREHFRGAIEAAKGRSGEEKEFTYSDAFEAGWEHSVTGLMAKHRAAEAEGRKQPFIEVPPDQLTLGKHLAMGVATLLGDIPSMVAGAVIAAPAGGPTPAAVVTAAGGAFALPSALRQLLVDKYEKGEVRSSGEFFERAAAAFLAEVEGFGLGAATAGAGQAVKVIGAPVVAQLGAEIGTLVTAGAALQGRLPEPEEFATAAILIGGLRASTVTARGLRRMYARTGLRPVEVTRDVAQDASIAADLGSKNQEIPRAYRAENPELQKAEVAAKEAALDEAIEAYHGTGATFEKFSSEFIGTGEGTQAFGHGYYFAESPKVAGGYHARLKPGAGTSAADVAARLLESGATKEQALAELDSRLARARTRNEPGLAEFETRIAEAKAVVESGLPGGVLGVRIRVKPDELLDWDAPFNAQSPKVQEVLRDMGASTLPSSALSKAELQTRLETMDPNGNFRFDEMTGKPLTREELLRSAEEMRAQDPEAWDDYFTGLMATGEQRGHGVMSQLEARFASPAKVAEVLRGSGIVGIRYLDAMSRKAGEGTRNIVIFPGEEWRIQIISRNGKPVTPPPGAPGAPPPGAPGAPPPGAPGTPLDRVLSRISIGEAEQPAPTPFTRWDHVQTQWLDRLHPLKKVVDAMAEKQDLAVADDAYKLARMLPGAASKAEHFLRRYPFKFDDLSRATGKPLREILLPAEGKLDKLSAYLASRRVLELSKRGIEEADINVADARAVVQQFNAEFVGVARELKTYQANLLRYYQESGMLSAEQVALMEAANAAYTPFYHVLGDRVGGPSAGGGLSPKQVVRRIAGKEAKIVDPLESIVKNTYALVEMAEKNRVATALVKLAESSPVGDQYAAKVKATRVRKTVLTKQEAKTLVSKVLQGQPLTSAQETALEDTFAVFRREAADLGKDRIAVYRDGEREVWQVHPEVWETFQQAGAAHANILLDILKFPARIARAGAVLSPEFIGRNPVRDQLSAFIFTQGFRPWMDMVSGIIHLGRYRAGKPDAVFEEWTRSGGPMATLVALDRQYLQQDLRGLMTNELRGAAHNMLRNPIEMLRAISEAAELGTRVGAFERMQKKGLGVFEAGFESREATVDFNRGGASAMAVNQYVPFFNASLQGSARMVRAFREKPTQTTARVVGAITIPSVLLYLHNRDKRWYQEAPQWERDLMWLYSPNDGETVYKIPKPFELGVIFGTGAERIAAQMLDADPNAFDGLLATVARGAAPSVWPAFALPVTEAWFNRSVFLDRPIVPRRLERILPEYQTQPYTTELAKAVGHFLANLPGMKLSKAASPLIIENTVRGWTGGLGVHLMNLADASLRAGGVLPEKLGPTPKLSDIPFIKGFVMRYPTAGAASIERFFERYELEERTLETIRYLAKSGDVEAARLEARMRQGVVVSPRNIQETLSGMSDFVRKVWVHPTMAPEEKRQVIDGLYFRMIDAARMGNAMLDRLDALREAREKAQGIE